MNMEYLLLCHSLKAFSDTCCACIPAENKSERAKTMYFFMFYMLLKVLIISKDNHFFCEMLIFVYFCNFNLKL